jgi:hypothetical protein
MTIALCLLCRLNVVSCFVVRVITVLFYISSFILWLLTSRNFGICLKFMKWLLNPSWITGNNRKFQYMTKNWNSPGIHHSNSGEFQIKILNCLEMLKTCWVFLRSEICLIFVNSRQVPSKFQVDWLFCWLVKCCNEINLLSVLNWIFGLFNLKWIRLLLVVVLLGFWIWTCLNGEEGWGHQNT